MKVPLQLGSDRANVVVKVNGVKSVLDKDQSEKAKTSVVYKH